MKPQETSTKQLVEIAKKQAVLGQMPENDILRELQLRYGWIGCPKEDLALISDLDRSVLMPISGSTNLPPRAIQQPGAKYPPPPEYYKKQHGLGLSPTSVTLNMLRSELNDTQRKYLNLFWRYYLDQNQWPTTFEIHREHDPDIIYKSLASLSGNLVFENYDSQGDRYELHLAGILLTKNGEKYQKLRIRLLEFLRRKYFQKKREGNANQYSDEEIGQALKLNEEQRALLGKLGAFDHVYRTQNFTTGGSWQIMLPKEIQTIPRTGSLAAYHDEILLRHFKRETPVFIKDRQNAYQNQSTPAILENVFGNILSTAKENSSEGNGDARFKFTTPAPDISFVNDAKLKSFAITAAKEACRCFDVEAFNSAAVMAGSATEAVLLDLLLQNKAALHAKLNGGEPLEKWRLADLITTALKLNLIGKATGNLAQQVREHRNLIHPGRSLREKHSIGRGEAEITLGILRLVCEELS